MFGLEHCLLKKNYRQLCSKELPVSRSCQPSYAQKELPVSRSVLNLFKLFAFPIFSSFTSHLPPHQLQHVIMEDFEPDTNLFAGNLNFQKLEITGSPTLWLDEFGKVYILNKHNASTDTTYLKCRQHTKARGTFS